MTFTPPLNSTERAITSARVGLARCGITRCGAVVDNPVLLTPSLPETGPNDPWTKQVGGGTGDSEPSTTWTDVNP